MVGAGGEAQVRLHVERDHLRPRAPEGERVRILREGAPPRRVDACQLPPALALHRAQLLARPSAVAAAAACCATAAATHAAEASACASVAVVLVLLRGARAQRSQFDAARVHALLNRTCASRAARLSERRG